MLIDGEWKQLVFFKEKPLAYSVYFAFQAAMFKKTTYQVERKYYCSNLKMKILIFAGIFVIVLVLLLIILHPAGVF